MKTQIDTVLDFFKTQVVMAGALGVTQPVIHYWLSGKRFPSAKNAIKMEQLTGGLVKRSDIRPDIFGAV